MLIRDLYRQKLPARGVRLRDELGDRFNFDFQRVDAVIRDFQTFRDHPGNGLQGERKRRFCGAMQILGG